MKKQSQQIINNKTASGILPFLFTLTLMLASMMGVAQTAYITNYGGSSVSVINVCTNTVSATIAVGALPNCVSVSPDGSKVYVTNANGNTVSVINTATNTVSATIVVGKTPEGISVSPDGSKVYVANVGSNTVSVIDTATNTVSATITVGDYPQGVSVSPDGSKVYITNNYGNTVSVINTATNTVSATIPGVNGPIGVSVSPDGSKVYVANSVDSTVRVINTATNTISATIAVGSSPNGVSVTPDGNKVYVANYLANTVSVINTATNTVSATIAVGSYPVAFGNFISTYPPSGTTVNFQSSDSTICANDCINFTDHSTNATSWQWLFYGAIDSTSTAQNPQSVCYAAAGTYSVKLVASNACGSDSVTFNNYITVHPAPPIPNITQHYDTLYCSTDPSYTSYQWYIDSTIITGATNPFLVITQNGNYNIKVTNAYGCFIGVGINITTGFNEFTRNSLISLYPNPFTSQTLIEFNEEQKNITIRITDLLGKEIRAIKFTGNQLTLGREQMSNGIYFVRITDDKKNVVNKKIVIQ